MVIRIGSCEVRRLTRALMTKTILLRPNFVLSKMSHESDIVRANLLSRRIALCTVCRTTSGPKTSSQMKKAHNFLRSQQANRQPKKQLYRINCLIINVWNKQTVLRRSFFPQGRHQRIHRESKARMFSFSLQSFWEKLVKPEKSQTYLVYRRINWSVVFTLVL